MDIDELIARPLDVIARLRAELKAQLENDGGVGQGTPVTTVICEALCEGDYPALERVPVLSRESLAEGKLPPNSLVRYRGMVQDQYEPEYFVGSFEEVETATDRRSRVHVKYVDSIPQKAGFVNEFDGPGAETMDRLPLFCIPIPGQSQWAHASMRTEGERQGSSKQEGPVEGSTESLPKRQRDAGGDAMDCADESDKAVTRDPHPPGIAASEPQRKTLRPSSDPASNGSGENLGAGLPAPGGGGDCAAGNPAAFLHRQELGLAGLACVVKVYDFREGQVKLNQTVEFVGVLGYDDALSPPEGGAAREGEEETGGEAGMVSGNPFQGLEDFSRKVPPPSLAPRLHCIFHRPLPGCAPLPVDPEQPKDALYALQGPLPFGAFMRDTKRQAVAHLARALDGDALAAEYALLALLSRVYVRTESLAPGSLSLNLRGMAEENVSRFGAAVSDLVPKCVTVPITTESLSEGFTFAPKKDYEADRLMMSKLQLSEGTVVILDETKLEPGQVGTEGISNLGALQSLISLQKVPYDFGFYKMDFEVDHPTISLSRRGPVVPASATVPVVLCGATAAGSGSDETALSKIRVYVEATRRMDLALDEVSSALAEEDFVKIRQQGQALTEGDFHRMLTVARLTALSHGDGMMTEAHWKHMKDLQAQVAKRVRSADDANATPAPPSQAGSLGAIPEHA